MNGVDQTRGVRAKLVRLAITRAQTRGERRPQWIAEAVDVLLDQWIDLAGVPTRPVDGWPSERRR